MIPARSNANQTATADMITKKLTLISRGYCHLCHDMEVALAPLVKEFGIDLAVLDVDADPDLESRYDELVPVLLADDGRDHQEICHYFLDEAKLRAYLAAS